MSQRARQARQRHDLRHAWIGRGLVVAILTLFVGAAFMVFGSRPDTNDGAAAGSASAAVEISMTEFAFDPDPIVLPIGDGARLLVVNDGEVAHDLLVGELGKGTPDLAPGDSMVLDLSDQAAGTYRVICDIAGHAEAGMVTELVLE